MTTFSQLIDELVLELLRPDYRAAMASWANQTIREIHNRPNSNTPIYFEANRYEDELEINTDNVYLWPLPSVTRFMGVEAIWLNQPGCYVRKRGPRQSRVVHLHPNEGISWYRGGNTVAIGGVVNGWTGAISYFQFPQFLAYKAIGARSIVYDIATDTYLLIGGGSPTEDQLFTETHWVLQRWPDVVKEGVRSKMWRRAGDDMRARTSFSAYETARASLWDTEPQCQDPIAEE